MASKAFLGAILGCIVAIKLEYKTGFLIVRRQNSQDFQLFFPKIFNFISVKYKKTFLYDKPKGFSIFANYFTTTFIALSPTFTT